MHIRVTQFVSLCLKVFLPSKLGGTSDVRIYFVAVQCESCPGVRDSRRATSLKGFRAFQVENSGPMSTSLERLWLILYVCRTYTHDPSVQASVSTMEPSGKFGAWAQRGRRTPQALEGPRSSTSQHPRGSACLHHKV